jgi:hypothetical protein
MSAKAVRDFILATDVDVVDDGAETMQHCVYPVLMMSDRSYRR